MMKKNIWWKIIFLFVLMIEIFYVAGWAAENEAPTARKLYVSGTLYLENEQYVKALECFEKLVELYPDSEQAKKSRRRI